MKNDFIGIPVHTLSGQLIAIELRYRPQSQVETAMQALAPLPAQYLLNQLLIIKEYAHYFRLHGLLCSVAIDFSLARQVSESLFIQQSLRQLPFVRLNLSEDFPNLHDGMDNPLLCRLVEQLNTLWLDNLGAGDANLHALQSGMFEAVKLDRGFYLNNIDKPFFPLLIKHIRQYASRVIVEGVSADAQLAMLDHSKIWGVQGYFAPTLTLASLRQCDQPQVEKQ